MTDKTDVIPEETLEAQPACKAVIDKITAIIKELTDEIAATTSQWVKVRNAAEIAVLNATLVELKKICKNSLEKEI